MFPSQRLPLFIALFLLAFISVAGPSAVRAAEDAAPTVAHMLGYIGVDYPATVVNGKVQDNAEYAEQREFAGRVRELLTKLPDVPEKAGLLKQAAELARLIDAKSAGTRVAALTETMRENLLRAYSVSVAPRRAPDLTKAATLYESQCAGCHGSDGRGQGPLVATALSPLNMRERLMLGWAGLRGAIPIWLATFPVIAGVEDGELIFNSIFFVVVASTLIQGATFEGLARRLGLTTDEPALPRPVIETGIVRRLGGESFIYVVGPEDAAAGALVRDLGLPREALVNLIVRHGGAIPPRGSTQIEADDEIHVIARQEAIPAVEELTERWRSGPLGEPSPPPLPIRGAPQVFTVRRRTAADGDPAHPETVEGVPVAARLRVRRDRPASLAGLSDGRYALTNSELVAAGGRRQLADWVARRAGAPDLAPADRAWWEEVAGALNAPAPRTRGAATGSEPPAPPR